jgi:hypothetical protein
MISGPQVHRRTVNSIEINLRRGVFVRAIKSFEVGFIIRKIRISELDAERITRFNKNVLQLKIPMRHAKRI